MYIGDVHDGSGLHHMIWEVVANSVDEHLAGFCRNVSVTLREDGRVTVEDDGRGIPVDARPDGVTFLERVLTTLHDGPTSDGHEAHVHVGLRGVGLFAVNALSRELTVETARAGRRYRQVFRAGRSTGPHVDQGPSGAVGTRVTFAPDPAIFTALELDATLIRDRLRQLAAFCKGLTLRFADERRDVFSSPKGIVDLLAYECRTRSILPEPVLYATGSEGRVRVEVALAWAGDDGAVRSFVNLHETVSGGTHVTGLKRGINELAAALPRSERRRVVERLQVRMVGVISVFHHDPAFDSPTKSQLNNPDVLPIVEAVVRGCLRDFAEKRPEDVARLLAAARG